MSDLDAFDAWMKRQARSPITARGYVTDMRVFADWYQRTRGEILQAKKVTKEDIYQYIKWLQEERKMQLATVRRHLMALRTFFRWALESGEVYTNPAELIKLSDYPIPSPRWLSEREQEALVQAAERAVAKARTPQSRTLALRDWALVIFLLNTGLRISEACALNVEDVEIGEHSGWVKVHDDREGKGRRVPLNRSARQALKIWLAERGATAGRLFGVMTPSGVQRRMTEFGRQLGIDVHPHALRHTVAKKLVDRGVNLYDVAALLGISNLNVLLAYVTSGTPDLERVVDLLEEPDGADAP